MIMFLAALCIVGFIFFYLALAWLDMKLHQAARDSGLPVDASDDLGDYLP